METSNFNITITSETVKSWQNELAELEKKMANDRQRQGLLLQRLHSLKFFLDESLNEDGNGTTKAMPQDDPFCDMPIAPMPFSPRPTLVEMSPRAAIGSWLKEKVEDRDEMVPISYLRECLEQAGYPMGKFGKQYSYFYTLLKRMEDSGEIIRSGEKVKYYFREG